MTLTDAFLVNMAKAAAGESYDTIQYFSVGETTTASISPTLTILPGEVGTRITATKSRTGNVIEITGTRRTTDVIDTTDGDTIATFGTTTDLAGSTLQSGLPVAGVTHTSAFDIDFIVTMTVTR